MSDDNPCVGEGIGGPKYCEVCGERIRPTVEVHSCLGSREAVAEQRQREIRKWIDEHPDSVGREGGTA